MQASALLALLYHEDGVVCRVGGLRMEGFDGAGAAGWIFVVEVYEAEI